MTTTINAEIAEIAGILWAAISLNCPLRLEYDTPLPCVVFDRTPRGGLVSGGAAKITLSRGAAGIAQSIDDLLMSNVALDATVLLSMDLFAAARLEITERARFVGLVSSIEPLAVQKRHDKKIEPLVAASQEALGQLKNLDDELERSLRGRIHDLRRESVALAVRRLMRERLPRDDDALETVTDAYNVRSGLVHEGMTDDNLAEKGRAFESVMRRLYSSILGRDLLVPA